MANITFSESGGVNDSIFGKSQAPIRMFIEKRAEAFEQKSMLELLFSVENSTHFGEKFTSMTAMDGFKPVGENGETPTDGMQEGYSKFLEHMTWKDSFSLSREIVEDSKLLDLKKKPAGFITGYYRTRERFAAAMYAAAMSGLPKCKFEGRDFDTTGADTKSLFATDHTAKIKGVPQSNKFSDDFSVDALAAAESAMQNFKGDNGEILTVSPDTIVIPNVYKVKKDVFAAIGADKDPNTANNAFNYVFGRWKVIVWPYLNEFMKITGGAVPWMLLDSEFSKEYGGAVWLDRTALDVNSRVEPGNHANVWTGYSRFTAGFNDWRFAAIGGVTGGTTLVS